MKRDSRRYQQLYTDYRVCRFCLQYVDQTKAHAKDWVGNIAHESCVQTHLIDLVKRVLNYDHSFDWFTFHAGRAMSSSIRTEWRPPDKYTCGLCESEVGRVHGVWVNECYAHTQCVTEYAGSMLSWLDPVHAELMAGFVTKFVEQTIASKNFVW